MKILIFLLFTFVNCDQMHPRKPMDTDQSFIHWNLQDPQSISNDVFTERWIIHGQNFVKDRLNLKHNNKKAKNVILFIGDGMGITTTSSSRQYLSGEETQLSFEKFPYYGLTRPYCVNRQVPDSACTATAFLGGVKNNINGLGVTANVSISACTINEGDIVYSIAKWSQDAGKATGIVTTTRVTHATPAAAYAHIPSRSWENNQAISSACRNNPARNFDDIAMQLVHGDEGSKFKVILGCGRREFLNITERDEENGFGRRTDGRNLINEWLEEKNRNSRGRYVWHKQQLDETDVENTDYLLGLFENTHCLYRNDIIELKLGRQEPLLSDMTQMAIKMLQKKENKEGYFLLVESGRIDHAHHSNRGRQQADETVEFARAVDVAKMMTNSEDTLIVVSADHSHVMSYAGYPARRNPVTEIVRPWVASDRMPYETLSYANGPSYRNTFPNGQRRNVTDDDFTARRRAYGSMVPRSSETHAGEDVSVYADGPWAHLFSGSYEQSVIAIAMAYAAQIGPYEKRFPINPFVNEDK